MSDRITTLDLWRTACEANLRRLPKVWLVSLDRSAQDQTPGERRMTLPITAYAALLIDGQEVGQRQHCRLQMTGDAMALDRRLTFEPAPHEGVGSVCFFKAPEGPEVLFEVILVQRLLAAQVPSIS